MKTIRTSLEYRRGKDTAATTDNYLFNQLIPYIGNKRKLLGLIQDALCLTDIDRGGLFGLSRVRRPGRDRGGIRDRGRC